MKIAACSWPGISALHQPSARRMERSEDEPAKWKTEKNWNSWNSIKPQFCSVKPWNHFRFSLATDAVEGFQKWIIRADYLPDNPMDTPWIKFAETIKRSRQIIAGVFFLSVFL
jgi:hypothetical protein